MDRNDSIDRVASSTIVALRKESVDRNLDPSDLDTMADVALRKESVDRNCKTAKNGITKAPVALRKESVDRNTMVPPPRGRQLGRSPQGERG